MRRAFTLIELMVSISIISIMMLYLYQSYAALNRSNDILKDELKGIAHIQKLKRVVFLDFSLAMFNSTLIKSRDSKEDFVFLQSSNSLHKRYNPYLAYRVKDDILYRLESLKPFKTYELSANAARDEDVLGEVKVFRVYKSLQNQGIFIVHIEFKNHAKILLKVKVLNQ